MLCLLPERARAPGSGDGWRERGRALTSPLPPPAAAVAAAAASCCATSCRRASATKAAPTLPCLYISPLRMLPSPTGVTAPLPAAMAAPARGLSDAWLGRLEVPICGCCG